MAVLSVDLDFGFVQPKQEAGQGFDEKEQRVTAIGAPELAADVQSRLVAGIADCRWDLAMVPDLAESHFQAPRGRGTRI